ncbi:AAA family ATPase [Costertonia aggregata]|uniref:ATP-binding protein n=1 Tax=Costertonia aggregata TaxID=343403 RepID=A0A7H9ATC5_9FLAO|nr:ATP-binding protein [Costertonia aggregata]QLG46733.1 ATP-binding protein [Costertonia aggregata]
MKQDKIVITGGPGTGKTAIIEKLQASGYHCFPEIIRLMTLEAKQDGTMQTIGSNPISSVSDPMKFNAKIIKGRVAQFIDAQQLKKSPVFFDRGIPDVLGYMEFFGQKHKKNFVEACENFVYDKVFLLPPWKEIYVRDNERFESFKEAEQIHFCLEKVYGKMGYVPITVPKGSIENRVSFILNQIEN